MGRYRVRVLEVEAVQWTGGNEAELIKFTDRGFMALDDDDRENCDNPEWTASVVTSKHGAWEGLHPNGWVIKNVASGEISIADQETFEMCFEPAR